MMLGTRRPPSIIEEDIVVKPSTELIADEYEHFQDDPSRHILVHTFASSHEGDQENVDLFLKTLKEIGFKIDEQDKHSMDNDNCMAILESVVNNENCKNANGLIMLFSGISYTEGTLRMYDGSKTKDVQIEDIWTMFNSYRCIGLKNKPKIFIFEATPYTSAETDGPTVVTTTYELAYDTPAEADILIVYNKSEGESPNDYFIDLFCNNIMADGDTEDIVSLVSCINSKDCLPLLISTLTRKFYFTPSEARGHRLIINRVSKEVNNHLEEVKRALKNREVPKKPVRRSFLNSFRIGKKSTDEGKKPAAPPSSPESQKTSQKSEGKGAVRKPHVVGEKHTQKPIGKGSTSMSRSRLSSSTSDVDARKTSLKKTDERPRWKN